MLAMTADVVTPGVGAGGGAGGGGAGGGGAGGGGVVGTPAAGIVGEAAELGLGAGDTSAELPPPQAASAQRHNRACERAKLALREVEFFRLCMCFLVQLFTD